MSLVGHLELCSLFDPSWQNSLHLKYCELCTEERGLTNILQLNALTWKQLGLLLLTSHWPESLAWPHPIKEAQKHHPTLCLEVPGSWRPREIW